MSVSNGGADAPCDAPPSSSVSERDATLYWLGTEDFPRLFVCLLEEKSFQGGYWLLEVVNKGPRSVLSALWRPNGRAEWLLLVAVFL